MDYNFIVNKVPISVCWEIYGDNEGLGTLKFRRFRFMKLQMLKRRTTRKS